MSRPVRTIAWTALLLCGAGLIAVLAGILLVQSAWFKDRVRARIASVIEVATGGRVEIGAFDYDWRRLTASITPFVLHGTESPGAPPFLSAKRVEVGFRIISALERNVDLAYLTVDQPRVYIQIEPDGQTNVPAPMHPSLNLAQELLNMKIRQLAVRDGFVDVNSRRMPLDVKAADVSAHFRYEAHGPRYVGEIASRSLQVNSRETGSDTFGFESKLAFGRTSLDIQSATVTMGQSRIQVSGTVQDPAAPNGVLQVKANVRPNFAFSDRGELTFQGTASFHSTPTFDWEIQGRTTGRGLMYRDPKVTVEDIALSSRLRLRPTSLELTDLAIAAPIGEFRGRAEVANWKKLSLTGEARGLALRRFVALDGQASGLVQVEASIDKRGIGGLHASAKLNLEPGQAGPPLQGSMDVTFDQDAHLLGVGDSNVTVGNSHIELSGTVGQTLTVHATSRDFKDVLRLLPLAGRIAPKDLPIVLRNGTARFDGTVSGPLNNPRISGQIDLTRFRFRDEDFDHFTTNFDLTSSGVTARNMVLSQGPFHLEGKAQAGLSNWDLNDSSAVTASISLRGAEIKRLLSERKWTWPVDGILAATAEIKGTYGSPQATAGIDAENLTAYDEHLNRVRASIVVSGNTLQVIDARLSSPAGQIEAKGSLEHAANDWSTGHMSFNVTSSGLALAQIAHIQNIRKGIGGQAALNATGTAILNQGVFRIQTITSQSTVKDIAVDVQRYGNLTVTANNRGTTLDIRTNANLLNTPIQGSGEWKLEGDDPGHGEIVIPHVALATLHELVLNRQLQTLPFDGFVEGKIDIDGPLRKPDQLKAEIQINSLQINANPGAKPRAGAQARDLILRNTKPIMLSATTKSIEVKSAQMNGTDTTVDVHGRFALDSRSPWDVALKGSINLAILQIFNPNLLGSGVSLVDATVRGTFSQPQLDGRLELKNASLYLTDLPNGLDQANGVILFDRNGATVDSLSAVTGGGRVTIQKGSFVGFRGPVLLYRVQASADHVRYRFPEGVSLTVNALLNLVGTSENSVLSGTLTVIRAAVNPTTDIGGLLASTAKPVSATTTPNEYLRGIQFDVRIESAQSLEIETSLTRNIQAEANLRIRGTPDHPAALGNLTVTEGQIEFFGNRYRINRAEVDFYNTVKIEPIIDMDLETSVRGITVDVAFTGPLSKLNFSYRSDPPLQTNDIIALLAVGRTPSLTTSGLASSQNTNTTYLSTGSGSLLSQALTAPASGRLQRFFGVSHIKIDPQLTDITSVPQARLTLEQQISKDITLTYITNLARTQEQIIRIEWDLSRQWSVIALRDENGAFGIDFQYRKRFK